MLIDSSEIIPLVRRRIVEIAEKRRVQNLYLKIERDALRAVLFILVLGVLVFLGIRFTSKALGDSFEPRQWGEERFPAKKPH